MVAIGLLDDIYFIIYIFLSVDKKTKRSRNSVSRNGWRRRRSRREDPKSKDTWMISGETWNFHIKILYFD